MTKMKKVFKTGNILNAYKGAIEIVQPIDKKRKPYLRISSEGLPIFLKDDLERFAVNILKALKSKKLKPHGKEERR